MWIRIDPLAAEPLYRQIVDAVKSAAARGRVSHGERLPSVRELSRELAINPNTVAKAYAELEREGVVVRRQGAGSFIKGDDHGRSLERRLEELGRLAERLCTEAFHLGLGPLDARRAVDDELAKLEWSRGADPRVENGPGDDSEDGEGRETRRAS